MMKFILATFVTLLLVGRAHAETWNPYDNSINHKLDAKWGVAVDHATKLSAIQNHGHVDLTRSCYANGKKAFCATVVSFKERNGHLAFVRVIRRGEDNTLFARDICQFNKGETVRTCVNFDNSYTSKWIEGDDGNWEQIDKEESDDTASGGL